MICPTTLQQALVKKEFPSPTGYKQFIPTAGSHSYQLMQQIKDLFKKKDGVLTIWDKDDDKYYWNKQPELQAEVQQGSAMVAAGKKWRRIQASITDFDQ